MATTTFCKYRRRTKSPAVAKLLKTEKYIPEM